jgi:hypothetical protein
MPEPSERSRSDARMQHLLQCADDIKRQLTEIRMLRDADHRVEGLEKSETNAWRMEIRSRVDALAKAVEEIKLAAAARDGKTASNPAMAALSAAGGGGVMFLGYIVGKALGLVQ